MGHGRVIADRVGLAPAWRARSGVTCMFLANGAGFGAWAASVPGVKQGLGLSGTALGGALLAVALGAIVAMPIAGWLGAHLVPRILTATGVAFMLALPLPALAGSLPALAASLLAVGAAAGSMDVCMNARASELEHGRGRAIMSSFHAAFSLGGLVGAGAVAGSEWLAAGFQGGLVGVSCLLGMATAAHSALDPRPGLGGDAVQPRIAWPGKAVLGIGLLSLLAFESEGAVADWSGVFLSQVAGLAPAATASGFAAFSAGMVAGRVGGDFVVRRFGPVRVLRLGGLLAACGFGLAMAWPRWSPVGFLLVGLGTANMAPVLFSAAGRAGVTASTGVAAVATMGYAGMLLGPPLVGVLADLAGLRAAFGVLIAAVGVIVLGGGLVRRW